jgi:hypothetical protein
MRNCLIARLEWCENVALLQRVDAQGEPIVPRHFESVAVRVRAYRSRCRIRSTRDAEKPQKARPLPADDNR